MDIMTSLFPGRVCLISDDNNNNTLSATFVVNNLRMSEGLLYNSEDYPFLTENVRWNTSDVCGYGIEIDGINIRIHYWLNGRYLGTAFSHDFLLSSSTTLCNMLPNGFGAIYFPGVSLRVNNTSILSSCEFVFSPEDMYECPLPNGYKPLLVPKLVIIVPYPYSTYLISEHVQDNIYRKRNDSSKNFLKDFVNDDHLETIFTVYKDQLILPKDSQGFPITIDHNDSWTITFDFNLYELQLHDLVLIAFNATEAFQIQIPLNKITDDTRTAIIFG
ncbi:unnamed protein product, partial [Rotaria sp. Silwood1]